MRPSVPRPGRGDYPRVTALLQYFSEITGYRKGVRQQLRAPPCAIPGLPSHAAMALRRPYPGEESELERSVTQTLITVPALALLHLPDTADTAINLLAFALETLSTLPAAGPKDTPT